MFLVRFRRALDWRQRRLQALLTSLVLVICAVLWLGIVFHERQRESGALAQAHRDVANLSIALREEVDRTLTGIDQVLRFIAADFRETPRNFDFAAWVRRADTLQPSTVLIGIADAAGEFVMSSAPLPPSERISVADREFFRVHAERSGVGAFVGRSVSLQTSSHRGFQISRRLETADGRFAGVVFAAIDPDRLAKRFAAIDIGASGLVTLIGLDGYIRVRSPAFDGMYDREVLEATMGQGMFASVPGRRDGTVRAASVLDGSERIFGYSILGSFQLAMVVGRSVSGILAPLQEEWSRLVAFGATASAAFGALLILLTRELDRRRENERQLVMAHEKLAAAEKRTQEANRYLRLGEGIAQVGHWRIGLSDASISWSDGLYRIFGIDPDMVVPTLALAIACCHPEDRLQVARLMGDAIEKRAPFSFEFRIVTPEGVAREVVGRGFCEANEAGEVAALFGTLLDVSDLRRAEVVAKEVLAVLTAALESMDQGLIVVSPDGRIQICNRRALELLELPADLMASRPSADEVLAHQWAAGEFDGCSDEIRELMRPYRGLSSPHSYARIRPNGTALEIRTMPMPGGGVVRTYTDVSAKREAEAALRNSESLYRLLAETTTDVITRLNLDFKREYVSPSCRLLFGFEPHEMVGLQPSAAMHPDDAGAVRDIAQKLIGGELAEAQAIATYRARHRSGDWIWVEAAMRLAYDDAGHPQSLVCSLRDVTQRKHAEAAREESEKRYRVLAENATDVIARLTLNGTLTFLSPSVTAVTGYAADDLLGRRTQDFMHPDDVERVGRIFGDLAAAGPGASCARTEYRIRHRAGHWLWIEVNPSCLFDADGRPTGFIDVVRDVTARKATDEALKSARAEAERAKSEAEAASRAKSEFLASMSHEVRTPLNGVLGYTEALLDDAAVSGVQRRYVERIKTAGSALLTVVNDILDFSKIEAGQVDLDPRAFSVKELMDGTIEIVRVLAESKRLELRATLDGSVPARLLGDPDRLRQVLLNLLNNAIKFTPHGYAHLFISCVESGAGVCLVRFEITDSGIGIAHDRRSLLFRRFSQVDGSARREHSGAGLGLAISKSLVEMMGGVIDVDSKPFQGSRFWFDVPLVIADAVAAEPTAPKIPIANASASVLLVEDMDFNQELVRLVLEARGYRVDVVGDGADAVMAVQANAYDLVLMDVQMPGMDGVTATKLIRELPDPIRNVPVIAMTANVLAKQVAQFTEAGMDDHIGKPFKRSELCAIVERWAGRRHVERATAA